MTQESRLVITVDSRKAKTELDSVDKSLKSVEVQGDKTAKKSKDLGGAFKQAGDAAKSAKDGVSSFDGSLGGLTKTLGSSNALLSSAAIGIAGVAGAAVGSLGAITGMALAYSNNAKEIQNLATVADMGVVEFQRMAIAAQQVGITQEQLSDQIKDFNEKLGEFVLTGKGEATDAFELLQKHSKMSGEEIKKFALEMQKASGGDAMQMYVNKLEEAGVSQEQMSFLTENMANDFTKLLPILADNGAMIKQWGDAGEEAGAVMQETAIQQALLFGSQVKDLELKLKGMQNTVMVAVVPALIDVADAFFNSADNGNTMRSISETLGNTLRVLGGIAIVVGRSFNALGMAIGAAAAAQVAFVSGDFKGALNIAGQGIKDQIDNIEAGYKQIKAIASTDASSKVKPLERPKNNGSGEGGMGVTTGLDGFAAGGKGKSKKGTSSGGSQKSDADKRKREAEQLAREIARIEYEYSSAEQKRKLKLNDEISKLQEKGMSEYIPLAKARYQEEEKLIQMKFEYDLVEHRLTEEQKLRFSSNIKEQEIKADAELTKEQRNLKLDSLNDQFNQELSYIKLAKEQRIFQAEQAMMTEIQFMQERYRLEREEIIKTTATDLEERKRKLNALNTNTIRDGVGKNFSDPDDRGSQFLQSVDYAPISKSNSQRLDEEFEKEQAKMLANFEKVKQLNADNHEAILEAERIFLEAKQQLQDEYDFKAQDARRLDYENQLNMYGSLLSLTGGVFDELSGIVSQYKDENTKTYKTMFAFQKAAAFAQAIVSTELAAIQVMADPTALTLAQKQMHANIIRLTGYASAGIIAAQAFMGPGGDGYANGGFTGYGGKFDPAGIVHKGEVVWSQEDIKRWGGVNVVEAMRTSQPPAGYSDGGIVNPRDTYRVGMGTVDAINRNSDVQAERQAQASAKSQQSSSNGIQGLTIINQIEQEDLVGGYFRKPAAGQLILNLIKANPSEFKRAMGV